MILEVELENIQRLFGDCEDASNQLLKMNLWKMYEPSTTSLVPPTEEVKTKGWPSSKVDTLTKMGPSYFEIIESDNNSHFF